MDGVEFRQHQNSNDDGERLHPVLSHNFGKENPESHPHCSRQTAEPTDTPEGLWSSDILEEGEELGDSKDWNQQNDQGNQSGHQGVLG